jgi:hypothetical protein
LAGNVEEVAEAGSLTMLWTIVSSGIDSACTDRDAETLVLRLIDENGNQSGDEVTAPCTDFAIQVEDIVAGTYALELRLENGAGDSLTAWKELQDVVIEAEATTVEDVNFASAMFVPSETGSLEVDWAIAGKATATACTARGAETLVIKLYDERGNRYGDPTQAACADFSVAIRRLPVGDYTLTAVLVDAGGDELTTTVDAEGMTIAEGETTSQSLAFPEDSFYGYY